MVRNLSETLFSNEKSIVSQILAGRKMTNQPSGNLQSIKSLSVQDLTTVEDTAETQVSVEMRVTQIESRMEQVEDLIESVLMRFEAVCGN